MFLVCLFRVWEFMGKYVSHGLALDIVVSGLLCGLFWTSEADFPLHAVSGCAFRQHLDADSHKKLLPPMFSHGIPISRDESRNSKRGDTDLDAVSKQ
jgi:hypothetical protein